MEQNIETMLRNAQEVDVPNSTLKKVDGVLKKLERRENKIMRNKFMKSIVASAAVLMLLVGVTFATTGGLDGLIARFNPAFGILAAETMVYAEEDDIRIEIIGGQQFGDAVLFYLTMQDLSSQNRINRYSHPDFSVLNGGEQISDGGISSRRIHFAQESGKIYLEIIGHLTEYVNATAPLEILVYAIRCYGTSGFPPIIAEGSWRMELDLDEIAVQGVVIDGIAIATDDVVIEYISISPLGVRLRGTHNWSREDRMHPSTSSIDLRVEKSNRAFNIRPRGGGLGISDDCFNMVSSFASPLEMEYVTAIIVNGVRIPLQ